MNSIMRDASTLTQLKQARALYAYNKARSAAVIAGQTVKPEASITTNDLVNARNMGGPYTVDAMEIFKGGCACENGACSGCPPSTGSEH